MKNIFVTIVILLLFTSQILSQANIKWLNTGSGTKDNSGTDLAIDETGNVFLTGKYFGTVQFNDSVLTTLNEFYSDIFLLKYNDDGIVNWIEKAGSNYHYDQALSICKSEENDVYISGNFTDDLVFEDTILQAYSGGWVGDGFIARYSTTGEFKNAIAFYSDDLLLNGIFINSGQMAVCGTISASLTLGNDVFPTIANYSKTDIIFLNFDTALNYQNGARYNSGSWMDYEYANSISVDNFGSSYMIGEFPDVLNLNQITINATSSPQSYVYYDIFIIKHDSLGNVIWANSAGGSQHDYGRDIVTDSAGNSYITGYFQGTATFGSQLVTSNGGYDIFVACCNSSGQWQWVVSAGGTGDDQAFGISMNELGGVYITGKFENSINFTGQSITSNGGTDIFFAKYDIFGGFLWAESFGSTADDGANSIDVSENGTIALTGYFQNAMTIDTITVSSNGGKDIFVASFVDTTICGYDVNFDYSADVFSADFYTLTNFDISVVDIYWDFGDGTIIQANNTVSHLYDSTGEYFVQLTVISKTDSTCFSSAIHTIFVDSLPCSIDADFSIISNINKHVILQKDIIHDSTLFDIVWNMGNGTTITGTNYISYTYYSNQIYTINCTVSQIYSDSTCTSNTYSKTVDLECYNDLGIDLYEIAISYIGSWYYYVFAEFVYDEPTYDYGLAWNWGNGDIDTVYNDWYVAENYYVAGNYTVSYSYWDLNDSICINYSNSFTITVQPPDCSVSSNIGNIFLHPYDSMTVVVQGGGANDWDYSWNFGDDSYGGGDEDEHTYTDYGVYQICLTTTNPWGVTCSETTCEYFTLGTPGCNDTLATNYNPNADFNNGSCIYQGTQAIPLPAGWSIFSTFIEPTVNNIDSVFKEIVGNTVLVKNQIGLVYYPQYSITLLDTLALGQGYQVKMASGDTLNVTGIICQPSNSPISLAAGWSIIGYLRQTPENISQIFSAIVSNTEIVKDELGNIFWPQYSINNIGNMLPGKGYQVKMINSDVLVYLGN